MSRMSFLDYWKQAIADLGVGALSAFDIQLADYREATELAQIDLAADSTLVLLMPLLDEQQQRLLVLMVGCRNPMLARELSMRSQWNGIDRPILLAKPMQDTAVGLIRTHYKENNEEQSA
ncbi:MAG: hypothetical protein V7707_08080 [Motiliproteus sp.]